MPDTQLQPFNMPEIAFKNLPNGLSADTIVQWFIYLVIAFWTIYSIVAAYHWFKYSHEAKIAYPAIVTHFIVSAILIAFTLSGAIFTS